MFVDSGRELPQTWRKHGYYGRGQGKETNHRGGNGYAERMRKVTAYTLIGLLYAAANVLPLAFFWLVWPRTHAPAPLLLDTPYPLLVNALVALIFPLQHTVWTQRPVKQALHRAVTPHFERPLYVLGSGIGLVLTALLWQPIPAPLWDAPGAAVWALRGVFVLSIAGQIGSTRALGTRHMSGVDHVVSWAEQREVPEPRFQEKFLYNRVRHPIAMCQLIMLWSFGALRLDLFLLAAMWTAWIVLATILEERRLSHYHGAVYAEYKKRAGFLWPRLIQRG